MVAEWEGLDKIGFKSLSERDSSIIANSGVNLYDIIPDKISLKNDGEYVDWHYSLAYGVPVSLVLPALSQLENDILTSEISMLEYLSLKVSK